jgi:RES domain-containing protein
VARDDVSLWRIAKDTPDYSALDLTGGGAKAVGGRWNKKGTAVVYTASSIALATLETLAHLGDNIAIRNTFVVRVTVPAAVWKVREYVDPADLPATWLAEPPGSASIDFGDDWINAGSTALLLVPSVIVPEEFNVLINPAHFFAAKISATVERQFIYDPRL